ncbi:MAG: hypothetical protein AAFQ83_23680 [Bacteroidota bacterium]
MLSEECILKSIKISQYQNSFIMDNTCCKATFLKWFSLIILMLTISCEKAPPPTKPEVSLDLEGAFSLITPQEAVDWVDNFRKGMGKHSNPELNIEEPLSYVFDVSDMVTLIGVTYPTGQDLKGIKGLNEDPDSLNLSVSGILAYMYKVYADSAESQGVEGIKSMPDYLLNTKKVEFLRYYQAYKAIDVSCPNDTIKYQPTLIAVAARKVETNEGIAVVDVVEFGGKKLFFNHTKICPPFCATLPNARNPSRSTTLLERGYKNEGLDCYDAN